MRILILSLKPHHNFGGILQTYALQTVLERMGHQVEVADMTRDVSAYPKDYHERIERESVINRNCYKFIDKYIHRRPIIDFSDIKETDYDAIVVGSDQVWRRIYFLDAYFCDITNAYLSFAKNWKNLKRFTYAASFGNETMDYTPEELEECTELLSMFKAVSIREISGINLCRKYFGIDALMHQDPTLLLEEKSYSELCKDWRGVHKDKIMAYILDETEDILSLVDMLSCQRNKSVCFMNSKAEVETADLQSRIQYSVEEWLAAFMDADYVVTDSFHGCVFSVMFGKEFVVFPNVHRGQARVQTLLHELDLEDRLVASFSSFDMNSITSNISEAQKKLQPLVASSLKYLRETII